MRLQTNLSAPITTCTTCEPCDCVYSSATIPNYRIDILCNVSRLGLEIVTLDRLYFVAELVALGELSQLVNRVDEARL